MFSVRSTRTVSSSQPFRHRIVFVQPDKKSKSVKALGMETSAAGAGLTRCRPLSRLIVLDVLGSIKGG